MDHTLELEKPRPLLIVAFLVADIETKVAGIDRAGTTTKKGIPVKEDEKRNQDSQNDPGMEKRLAMIKTEVSFDFPGLLESLEAGKQMILIKSTKFGTSLSPDVLRRIGNVTALCNQVGATLIFVNPNKLADFDDA